MRQGAAGAALVLVLALAGCSGGEEADSDETRAATTPAVRDPGSTLGAFLDAAGAGDAAAMWGLLSRRSRARLGPELADFRARATELARTARRVGGGAELILAERITARWAVAAVGRSRRGSYAAYAAPLRLENGRWRVEVADPLRIRPIRPDPGERLPQTRTQVAAEFKARSAITAAGLWLDGRAVRTRAGGLSPGYFTAFGESGPLEPGSHSVVAFASTARDARAMAWTFVIRASGDA